LDIGSRRIGVAVSDPLGITAQGVKTITKGPGVNVIEEIRGVVSEFDVSEIVVGLPLNMDGTRGKGADEAVKFIDELKSRIDKPIKAWDERLTTMEAEKLLISSDVSRKKRKVVKDILAAQLILQNYLESK